MLKFIHSEVQNITYPDYFSLFNYLLIIMILKTANENILFQLF